MTNFEVFHWPKRERLAYNFLPSEYATCLDVSKSDGKKVSLVTLNSDNVTQRDKYDNAETVFHEIKSHIDLNVGGNINLEIRFLCVSYAASYSAV